MAYCLLALALFNNLPRDLSGLGIGDALQIYDMHNILPLASAERSEVPVDIDYKCPIGVTNPPELPAYCEIEVPLNEFSSILKFKLGGSIYNITAEFPSKTLSINFTEAYSKGIQLALSRELIDARSDDTDSNFTVILDGQNVDYTELKNNSTTRELFVPTSHGDHVVQIVGTYVAPEFPSIVLLVLPGTGIMTLLLMKRSSNFSS